MFRSRRHGVVAIQLHNSGSSDLHDHHDHHDTCRARRARQLDYHHANPITIKVQAFAMVHACGTCQ